MRYLTNLIAFVFSNFGPLIGFYFINQFWGFKVGIVVSFLLIFVEYFWLRWKKKKISTFFYFSSGIILIFGGLDLFLLEPYFFKYEASLANLMFAGFFGLSLLKEKPIVQEFAEAQNRTSMESSPDKLYFFKFFTIVWCLYFILKAAFYLWINFNSSLNEALLVRIVVGKVSFWVMMILSVGFPKQIWRVMERLRLLPSQK